MHITQTARTRKNFVSQKSGSVWNRLRSERDEVCSSILHERSDKREPKNGVQELELSDENTRHIDWSHREFLQARLRQLDDAMDRLIAGSYGDCSNCGRWIEDTRLTVDPAAAFCVECQQKKEGRHL